MPIDILDPFGKLSNSRILSIYPMYSTHRLCRYLFNPSITRVQSIFSSKPCTSPSGANFHALLGPQIRLYNSSRSSGADNHGWATSSESENQIEAPAFRSHSIPARCRLDGPLASRYSAKDLAKEKADRPVEVFREDFVEDSSATYFSRSIYTGKPDDQRSEPAGVYMHEFEVDDDGVVALVEIGNPLKANSLSSQTLHNIDQTFRNLAKRDDLRGVILTGCNNLGNPIFSAGANIKEMDAITTMEQAQKFISTVFAACEAVRKCPVPTIARIEGSCYGAALEIAACCDFRYGIHDSKFSMAEVGLGIPSVIQARMLANIIGWQQTKELVLLGKEYSGKRMRAIGLLDGSYQNSHALDYQIDKVVKIIANNGPKATRAQKALIRFWEENPLKSGIVEGIETFSQMWEDGGREPKQYMGIWLRRIRQPELKEFTDDDGDEVENDTEDEVASGKALKWNFLKLRKFTEGDRRREPPEMEGKHEDGSHYR